MTQRRRRNKRWIGKVVFLVLIILAGVICYFVWDNYFRDKETQEVGGELDEIVDMVEKNETKQEQEVEVVEKEEIKQYEGEDPNKIEELTGVITYAGVAGDNFLIRVNIDQYLSDGTCELSLMQDGGVVYSDVVEIIDSASTATCAGFNVPVTRLDAGDIGITIRMVSGDREGTINGRAEL